jgi:hypothetical protein
MLVEFVLGVGLWAIMLIGTVTVLRQAHEKQILNVAARLGTFLQSFSGVDEAIARGEVRRYLSSMGVRDVQVITGRYLDTPSARFYRFCRTRLEKGSLITEIVCEQEGS